ncbi:NAD(P)H-dependent oxidoreductase [Nocardioides sp. MAHUQ-72]|uniref:NAD(P)H-dependent oxidoreductase n=1 Tax=unclassified Nocardioides TaxID=2615069 RepID=UPI00360D1CBD
MSRTLVLLAHPHLESSRVNSALADAVRDLPGVTVRALVDVRGEQGFDRATEQQLLVEHDTVVLQFPGPDASYRHDGYNRFTMDDLLRPIDATAHLCGMTMAPPFVVHGARAVDDASLTDCAARLPSPAGRGDAAGDHLIQARAAHQARSAASAASGDIGPWSMRSSSRCW